MHLIFKKKEKKNKLKMTHVIWTKQITKVLRVVRKSGAL